MGLTTYCLLDEEYRDILTIRVNKKLREGWECQGGVSFVPSRLYKDYLESQLEYLVVGSYIQAMIKRGQE